MLRAVGIPPGHARPPFGRRARVLLVLTVSGCSALLSYPAPAPEDTQGACRDGVDNDFDQTIDCADPSCDGFCLEQDGPTCKDARDNDGDGLVDADDPRCWSLKAPDVERCASSEPTDFEERFDSSLSESRWQAFGSSAESVQNRPVAGRADRADSALAVVRDAGGSAGVASRAAVDGDWGAFELGFHAKVPAGGLLRVALVPDSLVAGGAPALDAGLTASVAVDLDRRSAPALKLMVQGAKSSAPLPDEDSWHWIAVRREQDSLRLSLDDATVLTTPAGSGGPSRLVVWGAAAAKGDANAVWVDDLHLRIAGSRPCGHACPQIPFGDGCRLDSSAASMNVGYTVSVARDAETGIFCAAVSSGALGQNAPVRAQSWLSALGEDWVAGGDMPGLADNGSGEFAGVAVARDAAQRLWRMAAVQAQGQSLRLVLSSSVDCANWSAPEDAGELPADTGAPSYLVPGVRAPYEVYFTQPPGAAGGVALRRLVSANGSVFELDPAPVALFPSDSEIETPAALGRVGPRDVVLVHRISPASGVLGLGLWVSQDDDLASWSRSQRWPLIESVPALGGFDSSVILAGAVGWQPEGAFLLLGAKGVAVPRLHSPDTLASVTVGSARLVTNSRAAGAETTTLPLPGRCGDGSCESGEMCGDCPIDCGPCDGNLVLADRFESSSSWDARSARGKVYVSSRAQRAQLAPVEPGWLLRQLAEPLEGDWELSFDAQWVAPSPAVAKRRCTAYVGLARSGTQDGAEPAGVFVQLDQGLPCDPDVPGFSAAARVHGLKVGSLTIGGASNGTLGDCAGVALGTREAWHHVVLQRKAGQLSVSLEPRGTCGSKSGDAAVDFAGTLGALDNVVIGWGGGLGAEGVSARCDSAVAGLSIDNLVLRSLPCPQGGTPCESVQTGKSVCVDTAVSPEHCGGCGSSVGVAQECSQGKPTCGATECPGPVSQECVDLSIAHDHCGSCGHAVGALESCGDGYGRAAMVPMPDGFSIDATEVTRAQYTAWLATLPPIAVQPSFCVWNTSFDPSCYWPADSPGERPADCVDWCDARAYCQAVGKRLCGAISGGPASWNDTATTESQWYAACSSGGANPYPYGSGYAPKACHGVDNKLDGAGLTCAAIAPAASLAACQATGQGYAGVFDLSGNVREWIDSCSGSQSGDDLCRVAGGSVCEPAAGLRCDQMGAESRAYATTALGFRCCSL